MSNFYQELREEMGRMHVFVMESGNCVKRDQWSKVVKKVNNMERYYDNAKQVGKEVLERCCNKCDMRIDCPVYIQLLDGL